MNTSSGLYPSRTGGDPGSIAVNADPINPRQNDLREIEALAKTRINIQEQLPEEYREAFTPITAIPTKSVDESGLVIYVNVLQCVKKAPEHVASSIVLSSMMALFGYPEAIKEALPLKVVEGYRQEEITMEHALMGAFLGMAGWMICVKDITTQNESYLYVRFKTALATIRHETTWVPGLREITFIRAFKETLKEYPELKTLLRYHTAKIIGTIYETTIAQACKYQLCLIMRWYGMTAIVMMKAMIVSKDSKAFQLESVAEQGVAFNRAYRATSKGNPMFMFARVLDEDIEALDVKNFPDLYVAAITWAKARQRLLPNYTMSSVITNYTTDVIQYLAPQIWHVTRGANQNLAMHLTELGFDPTQDELQAISQSLIIPPGFVPNPPQLALPAPPPNVYK